MEWISRLFQNNAIFRFVIQPEHKDGYSLYKHWPQKKYSPIHYEIGSAVITRMFGLETSRKRMKRRILKYKRVDKVTLKSKKRMVDETLQCVYSLINCEAPQDLKLCFTYSEGPAIVCAVIDNEWAFYFVFKIRHIKEYFPSNYKQNIPTMANST